MDQFKFASGALTFTSVLGLSIAIGGTAADAACDDEGMCTFEDGGSYHIRTPDTAEGEAIPAVVFLHGFGSSGEGALRMRGTVKALQDRGYAVIAPDGARRADGRRSWNFFPGWEGRDETAFLQSVVDDAKERFDVDPERVVLAGFSAGGFMVNYLACETPDMFAAYAPVAGGFWRPQPSECNGPIRLHHTHGWSDTVVPLEGRYLRNGTFQQGDIYAGLEVWRDALGCETHAPSRVWSEDKDHVRQWSCGDDSEIRFTLHPGGHAIPQGWADKMVDWFEYAQPSQ